MRMRWKTFASGLCVVVAASTGLSGPADALLQKRAEVTAQPTLSTGIEDAPFYRSACYIRVDTAGLKRTGYQLWKAGRIAEAGDYFHQVAVLKPHDVEAVMCDRLLEAQYVLHGLLGVKH